MLLWLFRRKPRSVEIVEIGEDDLAVITFPDRVTHEELARLREEWNFHLAGRKLLVLQGGAKISVLKKGNTDGRGDSTEVPRPSGAHP